MEGEPVARPRDSFSLRILIVPIVPIVHRVASLTPGTCSK
jgi:hypothetical protein